MLPSSNEVERLQNYLRLAAQDLEAGQLEDALQNYQAALGITPQNIAVLHQIAKLYETQGNFVAAIDSYKQAIALQPEQPFWVYRHLGFSLAQQNQLQDAISAYERAIALQPQDDATYSLLGKARQQIGNQKGAAESYKSAIALNAQQPVGVYIALGDVLSQTGDIEGAIAAYETARELDPENIGLQRLLADAYARQEFDIEDHLKLAQQCQNQGKLEEALYYYQSILAFEKDNLSIWHQIAKIYESQEKFAEAIDSYKRAIAIEPKQPFWVYRHLGFALVQQEQLEEAIAAYQQAITLQSEDDATYNLLGQVQKRLGNQPSAIESFQQAIALSPQQSADVYIALGTTLSEQGKLDEAIAIYETALKFDPENTSLNSLLEEARIPNLPAPLPQSIQTGAASSIAPIAEQFSATDNPVLQGSLTQVDGCLLKGWVWNPANPQETLALIVYKNNTEILRFVANCLHASEPEPKLSGVDIGKHYFAVRLPLDVCQVAPFNLKIVVEEYDWILTNSQIRFEYNPIYKISFQGHCEPIVGTCIGGWALDNDNLDQKLNLYIYDEFQFLLKTTASLYRPDLKVLPQWEHGDGFHGYMFEIPNSILSLAQERRVLHICYENSSVELHNSPLIVDGKQILYSLIEETQNILDRSTEVVDRLIKLY